MMSLKKLNEKALTVKLTISKPRSAMRDIGAEAFAQSNLNDSSLRVSSKLFQSEANPVRGLLNSSGTVYTYHKEHTLPHIDRGPRLLPGELYETYRERMRALVKDVEDKLARVMPRYDDYVAQDMSVRGARASLGDYQTATDFEAAFKLQFTFAPLPSRSHFLFDVSDEDLAALDTQLEEMAAIAQADLYARLKVPVKKLLDVLCVPVHDKFGKPQSGAIFRDTKVSNVTEAVNIARSLAMGDELILSMCDDIERTMAPVVVNPDVLRESPVVRESAARRLKEVADRMAFMYSEAA